MYSLTGEHWENKFMSWWAGSTSNEDMSWTGRIMNRLWHKGDVLQHIKSCNRNYRDSEGGNPLLVKCINKRHRYQSWTSVYKLFCLLQLLSLQDLCCISGDIMSPENKSISMLLLTLSVVLIVWTLWETGFYIHEDCRFLQNSGDRISDD